MAICKDCGQEAFREDYHDDCVYAGLTAKQIRFSKFETAEAKRLEDIADESEINLLVISGKVQGIVPVITDAGQTLADEMGVPIGEEKGFYLQPPNRQYFRRAFKEHEKSIRSVERKEYLKDIEAYRKPSTKDPNKLPTHLIHKIFKARRVSIRLKQNRLGMVGAACDHKPENQPGPWTVCGKHTTVFNPPLFWKIIQRRGKRRAVRKAMENDSRREQWAA